MTTTDIRCNQCGTKPRLKSLDKNNGTGVECDCDGAKYHMDSVPYELTVGMLPEPWELEADQDKHDVPDAPETIRVDLPRWMVKQLRGTAIHSKHEAKTEYGREDAQKIVSLLTYCLEEADQ